MGAYIPPIAVSTGYLLTLAANQGATLTIGDGGTLAGMAYQAADGVAITGGDAELNTLTTNGYITLNFGSRIRTSAGGVVFEPFDGFTYFDASTKTAASSTRGFSIASDRGYYFTSGGEAWQNFDVKLQWNSSGKIEINNGTLGTYRDLILRSAEVTGDLYLHSPNGNRWKINVANDGTLSTSAA